MKIDVSWFSEDKRILYILYHPNWTWDDFHAMRRAAKSFLREVVHPVAILQEYDEGAGMLPTNAFTNLSVTFENAEKNSAMAVLVTRSEFWRVVLGTLKRIMPKTILQNTYFVHSRAEALQIIDSKMNSKAA